MYKITTWLCHVVDFNVSIKLRMSREKKSENKNKTIKKRFQRYQATKPAIKTNI